ncbi:9528_t:CDS:2, partial [Funneliformis mosseae]
KDYSNQDFVIEHTIAKRQIYGEYAVLGQKLASLVAEFNLTHVAVTLQGLIQQVEQSNINSINNQTQNMILNPLQDGYICQNCLKDGYNTIKYTVPCKTCKRNEHTYLHFSNKENVSI